MEHAAMFGKVRGEVCRIVAQHRSPSHSHNSSPSRRTSPPFPQVVGTLPVHFHVVNDQY